MDRGTQLAHPCFDKVQRAMYRGRKKERERESITHTHTHTTIYMYVI